MSASFPLLAVLLAPVLQEPGPLELRRALDTLRAGSPGEPAFDAAAQVLPSLIASGSGWFVEGGAYVAGMHGRKECVPTLLAALERENRRPVDGGDPAKRSILDALIRLDASVPVALLTQRLEESFLCETYLLLMRDPDGARDGLLALFDASPQDASARWAAACALVEARDTRVASRLLAGMEWELDVVVRDAGSSHTIGAGARGGGWSSAHERWPPKVTYELLLPADGAPLLPIGHVRREEARSGRLPAEVAAGQRAALKARLLDQLLGDAAERGLLQRSEDLAIDWVDAQACVSGVRAHCLGLRERLARVGARLELLGLLENARETCASIGLRVRLSDLRASGAGPLPSPPELSGVAYERP